jgi:hypothetical protein
MNVAFVKKVFASLEEEKLGLGTNITKMQCNRYSISDTFSFK